MKIIEIGTGYTSIPAKMGAATEIVVEELTKAMVKKRLDVQIVDICDANRKETGLPIVEVKVPAKFTGADVQLGLMHKMKRVVYSILLSGKLKKIIKKNSDNIILHFHNQYNMFFFLILCSKKIKEKVFIAYTNHSYIWHDSWENIESTVKKRYFQEIYCMKKADIVYVLNEKAKGNIEEHLQISNKKVKLINNGVNTDIYYSFQEKEKQEAKRRHCLHDKKVFIQVGSVCERKGQLTALKLMLPFMKNSEDIIFAYAGGIISADYQEEIIKLAKENKIEQQVRYMGELRPGKELNEFYNLAEAMIFPSKAEGFSLVILEAMSSGVPVFISNNLQFKLAQHCIRFADSTDFEEKIQNLVLDINQQKELSNKTRNTVLEEYSWDKVTEEYLSCWN